MFKVGDLAVYPAHGVGRIECVESKEIGGKKQDFYIMRMMENDMKIMIPIQNAEAVGLRQLIADAEIPKVYSILQTRKICVDGATWNRRYREYREKIKTGSIYELAEVLRDLCLLKVDKDLSFGERKMLTAGSPETQSTRCASSSVWRTTGSSPSRLPRCDGWSILGS